MKRVALLLPGAIGVVCALYTGIYLVRWEWNRAIIAGIFFLAAEIIVASALILERIRRSEDRIVALLDGDRIVRAPDTAWSDEGWADASAATLEALRSTAPPPPDRFAWIRDQSGQMNVFLPVLLGAGVVASALAWLVEHLARATVSPALERRLARRLDVLALPAGGFLGVPQPAPVARRTWPIRIGIVIMVATAGVLTAGALDYVADRTQTRPDARDPDAQTVLDLQLYGEIADRNPERVIHHLWAVCTGPDVFRSQQLPAPLIAHGEDGFVHIVVDSDVGANGMERLRGCLNDTTLDKVQARVVTSAIG
jgi:hypothetical protein